MIFLHCYPEFRLSGQRKYTEMNCKMEIIEIREILFCTAENFFMEFILLWCNVSILTHVTPDKQETFHKSCRMPAYSDAITEWRQTITHIELYSCVPMNIDRLAQSS